MQFINLDEALKAISVMVSNSEKDLEHALSHDNYGKAAVLHGEISGMQKVLRKLESGDFTCDATGGGDASTPQ